MSRAWDEVEIYFNTDYLNSLFFENKIGASGG